MYADVRLPRRSIGQLDLVARRLAPWIFLLSSQVLKDALGSHVWRNLADSRANTKNEAFLLFLERHFPLFFS